MQTCEVYRCYIYYVEAQEAIDEDHLDDDKFRDFFTGTLSEDIDGCWYGYQRLQNKHSDDYIHTDMLHFFNKINFLILAPRA